MHLSSLQERNQFPGYSAQMCCEIQYKYNMYSHLNVITQAHTDRPTIKLEVHLEKKLGS